MTDGANERWYRIPLLWLGLGILMALFVACAINVVLALQLSDAGLAEVAPSARFGFSMDGDGD